MKIALPILSLLLSGETHALKSARSLKEGISSSSSIKGGEKKKCRQKDFSCPKKTGKKGRKKSDPSHAFGGHVVIANRGGGTVSLVDPSTLTIAASYALPDDGEPMYFSLVQSKSEIWVGDRKNDRLVVLLMRGCDIALGGFLPTPRGTFHTMTTQNSDEYKLAFTTCDIDMVTVVHDQTTRRLLGRLERPREAADAGAKPHDCTAVGRYAFVTYLGSPGGAGFVASYDLSDFSLVAVLETASDPHVAVREGTHLAIAAQGGQVLLASVPDLGVISSSLGQPSPHGTFIDFDMTFLYVTNIAGGGEDAVVTYDVETGSRIDCPPIATSFPTPHNPALSRDGRLYITHSGPTSNVNSVFDVGDDGCLVPGSEETFETDLNPFGIFVLPDAADLTRCLA